MLPLSPTVLLDYMRALGESLKPHEAEAVMILDAAILHPDDEEEKKPSLDLPAGAPRRRERANA